MFLLFVLFCVAAAQSSGSEISLSLATRHPLTVAQNPTATYTNDEKWVVFTSSTTGLATNLFSIPLDAKDETKQKQLSQTEVAFNEGVDAYQVSPNNNYVLFTAQVQSTALNSRQYYSVPIGGGKITRITPDALRTANIGPTSPWTFRPCSCAGTQSDKFYGMLPTVECNCNTKKRGGPGCSQTVNELWVNTAKGDAKKLSVNLGQLQSEGRNKAVNNVRAYNDYIFYNANPGNNGDKDARHLYMVNWEGENTQITTTAFATNDNNTAGAFLRSQTTDCYGQGRYVAFMEYTQSIFYRSINLWDVETKTLRIINPTLAPFDSCSLGAFNPQQTRFYFKCNTTSTNVDLYLYNLETHAAATKISLDYSQSQGGDVNVVPNSQFWGKYLVFVQSPIAGTNQAGIVSYNWETSTSVTIYTAENNNGLTFQGIAGPRQSPKNNADVSAEANLWWSTSAGANGTTVWTSPIGAATVSSVLANADAVGSFYLLSNGNMCEAKADSNYCKLDSSCTCNGCFGDVQCAGYVAFTAQFTSTPNTQAQFYTATYTGTGLVTHSPDTFNDALPTNVEVDVVNPFGDAPRFYFTARVGDAANTAVTNLYGATAGTAGSTVISEGITAGGSVVTTARSDDGKYYAYQAQTGTFLTTNTQAYLRVADASQAQVQIGPTLTVNQTASGRMVWTQDSKYVVYFIEDNEPKTPPGRTVMMSALAAEKPADVKTYNLTANSNFTFVNSAEGLRTTISRGDNFHCNQKTLIYQTNLPEIASPANLYSVPLGGGKTSPISFNPFTGVSVTSYKILKSRFAVRYRGALYSSATDIFWSSAMAAGLAPMFGLLSLGAMVALLL